MPSAYSDNLRIELVAPGEQANQWGRTTNRNWEMVDAAISSKGVVRINSDKPSDGPESLSVAQADIGPGTRAFLELTDAGVDLGGVQHFKLVPANRERLVYIRNSLTGRPAKVFQTVEFDEDKALEVLNGETVLVYFDGGGDSSAVASKMIESPVYRTVAATGRAEFGSVEVVGGLSVGGDITVTGTVDGRDVAADGAKLDGIAAGAQANPTAAQILSSLRSVDGAGSGLDADRLDGQTGSYYQRASTAITTSNIGSQTVSRASTASTATNASQLGGVAASRYLRSDRNQTISAKYTFTSQRPRLNDSIFLEFGTDADFAIWSNSSGSYFDSVDNDIHIRRGIIGGGVTEFLFDISHGNFHADGDIITFSTSTSSDENLKENIADIGDPLTVLANITGVTFNWKRDGRAAAGVIAQDVERAGFKQAVKTAQDLKTGEDFLTVDYNQITALLVAAVNELNTEVARLRRRLGDGG